MSGGGGPGDLVDGIVRNITDIIPVDTFAGGDDDVILGTGNDIGIGGFGNDVLRGGDGQDVIVRFLS